MSILTVYIRLVNVYTRLTYRVGMHSILKACKLLGIPMKNQTSVTELVFQLSLKAFKIGGCSALEIHGTDDLCKVSENVNELAVCKIQPTRKSGSARLKYGEGFSDSIKRIEVFIWNIKQDFANPNSHF